MNERILRIKEVLDIFGVSKSTIYAWQDKNSAYYKPDFPKKIYLGARTVGYFESDVNLYLNSIKSNRGNLYV